MKAFSLLFFFFIDLNLFRSSFEISNKCMIILLVFIMGDKVAGEADRSCHSVIG